jgi:DNA polymerase III alpha subunit
LPSLRGASQIAGREPVLGRFRRGLGRGKTGSVLYALGAIRNVGLEAMKHLVEVRETGGRFTDIFDFLERVDPRSVNKRALENLARAGAFDSFHPTAASCSNRPTS